jgi:hypothetical protein
MADEKGQLLFGTVAVKLGFVLPSDVQEAARIQEQTLRLGVKKPLGLILREQGWITEDQERQIVEYQQFRRERTQDKKLGEVAVENGFCTEAQLKDALKLQKEYFTVNNKTYPLGKILQDRGILTEQQVRALVRLQQRLAQPSAPSSGGPKTMVGVRECGNCYEVVPMRAQTCPKCGNHFGTITIAAQCKICRTNQTTAGEYCSKCGAHLVTGAKPRDENLRQCLKCGRFGGAYANECLHCGHVWDATMKRERKKSEEKVRRGVGELVRWAITGVVVLIGLWALFNFTAIKDWVAGKAVGEEAVAVKNRAESFLKAVQFGDEKGAGSFLAAPKEFDALYKDLFGLERERYQVAEVKIADVKVTQDRATVYVDAVLGAIKKEDQRSPEEQLKAVLAGTSGERRKVSLEWSRQRNGTWVLNR